MAAKDKRKVILNALEKLLAEQRLDEVKVDQVAEAAGVGKGTVYRYFDDKDDLFFQMIQEFLKDEVDDVAVVAASGREPREKLIAIGETISEHIQRHGQYIRMLHSRQFCDGRQRGCGIMREHHTRLDRLLTEVFDEARRCALFRDAINPKEILCIYKGTLMAHGIRSAHDVCETTVEALVDLMVAGFGGEAV